MKVNAATDPFDFHEVFDRPSSCCAGAGFLIYGACRVLTSRWDRRQIILSFLDSPPPLMISVTYPDYIYGKKAKISGYSKFL